MDGNGWIPPTWLKFLSEPAWAAIRSGVVEFVEHSARCTGRIADLAAWETNLNRGIGSRRLHSILWLAET